MACSHGWSAARRKPGETEPVEWKVQALSPPRQGRRCAKTIESIQTSPSPLPGRGILSRPNTTGFGRPLLADSLHPWLQSDAPLGLTMTFL